MTIKAQRACSVELARILASTVTPSVRLHSDYFLLTPVPLFLFMVSRRSFPSTRMQTRTQHEQLRAATAQALGSQARLPMRGNHSTQQLRMFQNHNAFSSLAMHFFRVRDIVFRVRHVPRRRTNLEMLSSHSSFMTPSLLAHI
jgi:hypothetical protein